MIQLLIILYILFYISQALTQNNNPVNKFTCFCAEFEHGVNFDYGFGNM